jgi:hypothetical protein
MDRTDISNSICSLWKLMGEKTSCDRYCNGPIMHHSESRGSIKLMDAERKANRGARVSKLSK